VGERASPVAMVIYSFYIFDRHSKFPPSGVLPSLLARLMPASSSAECIYNKSWLPPSDAAAAAGITAPPSAPGSSRRPRSSAAKASDDAKLIFGTVFSLRNMVRKLGGDDDAFISYRTSQYKLHYYETASNLRFVMLTDTASPSMRNVLHQIFINLWVEYGKLLCPSHKA